MDLMEFDRRLGQVERLLPVSEAAIEVVHRVRTDDCDARVLADLIRRDAVLATELLRLVNSGFYNRGARKITDLHEAVTRVGVKRIGEIALAISTLKGLTHIVLPWFDKNLTHARSLAGCLVADRLLKAAPLPQGAEAGWNEGIMFCSLLHPLARLVVASAVPQLYDRFLEECRRTLVPLDCLERRYLPRRPHEALVKLVSRWGLPPELYAPMSHLGATSQELTELPDSVQLAVRLLQTTTRLAEYVVGRWAPWESVAVTHRGDLHDELWESLPQLLADVRSELAGPVQLDADSPTRREATPTNRFPYSRLGPPGFDFVQSVLQSMDFRLDVVAGSVHSLPSGTIVNALEAPADEQSVLAARAAERQWLVLLPGPDGDPDSGLPSEGVLHLPTSYRALFMACSSRRQAPALATANA